jgi:hypothetical protein
VTLLSNVRPASARLDPTPDRLLARMSPLQALAAGPNPAGLTFLGTDVSASDAPHGWAAALTPTAGKPTVFEIDFGHSDPGTWRSSMSLAKVFTKKRLTILAVALLLCVALAPEALRGCGRRYLFVSGRLGDPVRYGMSRQMVELLLGPSDQGKTWVYQFPLDRHIASLELWDIGDASVVMGFDREGNVCYKDPRGPRVPAWFR